MKSVISKIILFFIFSTAVASVAGIFFYKRQINSTIKIVMSDVAVDLSTSQFLQAEKRVEVLRRLGFNDLKIIYLSAGKIPGEEQCAFNTTLDITIDGLKLGEIQDCPSIRTIGEFLLGSSVFTISFSILFFSLLFTFTIPLLRYQNSIKKFISDSRLKGHEYFKNFHSDDAVILEISSVMQDILKSRLRIEALEYEQKNVQALDEQARQVAHDIRSPLSALNIVSNNLTDIPKESLSILHQAISRINEIAADLLKGNRKINEYVSDSIPINAIINKIISEKKTQYIKNQNISFLLDTDTADNIFLKISESDINRILSNIINNSIEALKENSGSIIVSTRKFTTSFQISIIDDGKGIPQEIISQIGNRGFSFGKENMESGTGLGVYHAKNRVEQAGGTFKINSKEGDGTIVTILLPYSHKK